MNPAPPPTQTLAPFPAGRVKERMLVSSVALSMGSSASGAMFICTLICIL